MSEEEFNALPPDKRDQCGVCDELLDYLGHCCCTRKVEWMSDEELSEALKEAEIKPVERDWDAICNHTEPDYTQPQARLHPSLEPGALRKFMDKHGFKEQSNSIRDLSPSISEAILKAAETLASENFKTLSKIVEKYTKENIMERLKKTEWDNDCEEAYTSHKSLMETMQPYFLSGQHLMRDGQPPLQWLNNNKPDWMDNIKPHWSWIGDSSAPELFIKDNPLAENVFKRNLLDNFSGPA